MRTFILLGAVVLALSLAPGCDSARDAGSSTATASKAADATGRVVVANRDDGTLSLIDAQTDAVTTVTMPDSGEPMYVVYVASQDRVFVGDRANDRVVVFDGRTFEVEGTVATGAGVFHMWADRGGRQLWVVGDQANTLTVVDPGTLGVLATVAVDGGTPHDVLVGPRGRYAYATIFVEDGADQVIQYDTQTFQELARADVGEDPHLTANVRNPNLFVPSQNSNVINVFDRLTLAPVADIEVEGTHGVTMSVDGDVLYTTNLPGEGDDGLIAVDARTNAVLGAVDTPATVPHNVVRTPDGERLYVTHSGPNTVVTVYDTNGGVPSLATTVTVGANPFGLDYVP